MESSRRELSNYMVEHMIAIVCPIRWSKRWNKGRIPQVGMQLLKLRVCLLVSDVRLWTLSFSFQGEIAPRWCRRTARRGVHCTYISLSPSRGKVVTRKMCFIKEHPFFGWVASAYWRKPDLKRTLFWFHGKLRSIWIPKKKSLPSTASWLYVSSQSKWN